jgi:transcriptional regulator with XRE-family HTH domain
LRFDGDKVHRARELLGYGLDKTAEEAGVSKNSVLRAERGEEIRPGTARKIATALGVRVADLLTEGASDPLGQALASQDRLFDGARERDAFLERVKEYIDTRVAHYEKRLTEAEQGGLLADYKGARRLYDDAIEEFILLPDLINGELAERWMLDPEVPEDVKVDLGRAVGEIMLKPFVEIVVRISARESELAETETQRQELERRKRELIERTREISEKISA